MIFSLSPFFWAYFQILSKMPLLASSRIKYPSSHEAIIFCSIASNLLNSNIFSVLVSWANTGNISIVLFNVLIVFLQELPPSDLGSTSVVVWELPSSDIGTT